MRKLPVLLLLLALPSTALAKIYIPVGEARVKKSVLAFPETKYLSSGLDSGDSRGLARTLKDLITSDLEFTNLFTFQSPAAFIEKPGAGVTLDTFRVSDWTTIGTEFLLKTGITINGESVAYEARLFDVLGAKQIHGKRYVAKADESRLLAHTIANDIIEALTGRPGVFLNKIAMVCDKGGHKEIWLTDFDGSNPKQLTRHGTLAFAPAWSPDNSKLAYSLYTRNAKNIKNIDLYEYDFNSGKARLLSNRKGINSGADYSPDGKRIALTMSFLGNPELFLLDPRSLEVSRLTKSLGFDVDPAWSPDGRRMAFVSSRSNQPMVYAMSSDGSGITRLTFAGVYNATPDWSPDGRKIAFASHLEKHFDLFVMNADGTALERLTKNEGSNEDPRYSPDGNFLVFTSNRTGQKNVYVISVDGQNTRRITYGLGNCEAPRWSHTRPK